MPKNGFERADKIVIVTHVSPDGDAIGSSLGLWHFFQNHRKKSVNVIVPKCFSGFFEMDAGSQGYNPVR